MTPQSIHALISQPIDYSDGTTVFEGYVVVPENEIEQHSCVVLAHEWSGLNDAMKRQAERYASLGYICFAIDVYGKGIRGDETGDNSHLMNPLLNDRALLQRRLLAGFDTAARFPGVDATRLAVVGYCFGGLCSLDLARAAPENLRSAVSFHGALQPPEIGDQKRIDASILLLHGWEDPIAPPSDVLAIAKELTEAKADWQLHAYGHAQHAFTFEGANFPKRGIVYHEKADKRSWAAMCEHLAATLQP